MNFRHKGNDIIIYRFVDWFLRSKNAIIWHGKIHSFWNKIAVEKWYEYLTLIWWCGRMNIDRDLLYGLYVNQLHFAFGTRSRSRNQSSDPMNGQSCQSIFPWIYQITVYNEEWLTIDCQGINLLRSIQSSMDISPNQGLACHARNKRLACDSKKDWWTSDSRIIQM